jgi:hypothetical protein
MEMVGYILVANRDLGIMEGEQSGRLETEQTFEAFLF